ncbi:MAG: hypothetical protein ABI193_14765, partial [Minicystis sp.]
MPPPKVRRDAPTIAGAERPPKLPTSFDEITEEETMDGETRLFERDHKGPEPAPSASTTKRTLGKPMPAAGMPATGPVVPAAEAKSASARVHTDPTKAPGSRNPASLPEAGSSTHLMRPSLAQGGVTMRETPVPPASSVRPPIPSAALVDPAPSPLDDRGFSERYEAAGILGEGGMGVVNLCKDARIGRQVAMKVLLKEAAARPDARMRFEREARVQGQLEHPSIVPVYDIERLEWTGLWPSSYVFEGGMWAIVPQLIELPRGGTFLFLAVATVAMIAVPALFIAQLRGDLTKAQVRLAVQ